MKYLALILMSSWGMYVGATVFTVKNGTELIQTLSRAKGGDTIRLQPGSYGNFSWNGTKTEHKFLKSYTSEVKITSASQSNPAVISSLKAYALNNLTFEGITFRAAGASRLVEIYLSSNVKFNNVDFIGRTSNSYGEGNGLYVSSDNKNIQILNSRFQSFRTALNLYRVDGLTVDNNDFSNIAYDVMQMAYVYNVLIQNNLMVKRANPALDNHQDVIQIANDLTDAATSRNIVIRSNRLEADDARTHGIFINNVRAKASGRTADFYQNIVIEDNEIFTIHTLALAAADINGLTIRGNLLRQNSKATSKHPIAIPAIRIGHRCTNVQATGNTLHFAVAAADAGNGWALLTRAPSAWRITPNTIVPLR